VVVDVRGSWIDMVGRGGKMHERVGVEVSVSICCLCEGFLDRSVPVGLRGDIVVFAFRDQNTHKEA
jgi:hypothetical protein